MKTKRTVVRKFLNDFLILIGVCLVIGSIVVGCRSGCIPPPVTKRPPSFAIERIDTEAYRFVGSKIHKELGLQTVTIEREKDGARLTALASSELGMMTLANNGHLRITWVRYEPALGNWIVFPIVER